MIRCPIHTPAGRCTTELQPYQGSMESGIAAHVAMIHDVPGPRAQDIARKALERGETWATAEWTADS